MNIYSRLLDQIQNYGAAILLTNFQIGSDSHPSLEQSILLPSDDTNPAYASFIHTAYSEGRPVFDGISHPPRLFEPFTRKERLLILGGGHIALALAEFASKTGFQVSVADERPSYANPIRFPWAAQVLCTDFPSAIQTFQPQEQDYIAILTRGQRHDADCLVALSHGPAPPFSV